jgi:hypothetical protein
MNIEPRHHVYARWRPRPFTILQGFTGETVKAFSVAGALRKTRLIPGSKVKVFVPLIVHHRRVKRWTLLRKSAHSPPRNG